MTKDEFLALPPDQRKKLAAQRSLERNQAKKEGKPIPPTLGEEFGLTTARAPRTPKEPVVQSTPKPKESVRPPKEKPVPGIQDLRLGQLLVERGTSAPMFRTLMGGLLHCVHLREDFEKYKAEAITRGFKSKMTYFDGEKPVGVVFFNELNEKRLRAILLGSRPDLKVTFGEKEAI